MENQFEVNIDADYSLDSLEQELRGESASSYQASFEDFDQYEKSEGKVGRPNVSEFENNIQVNNVNEHEYFDDEEELTPKQKGKGKKPQQQQRQQQQQGGIGYDQEIYNIIENFYIQEDVQYEPYQIVQYAKDGAEGFYEWIRDYSDQNAFIQQQLAFVHPIVNRFNNFIANGGHPSDFMRDYTAEQEYDIDIFSPAQMIIYDHISKSVLPKEQAELEAIEIVEEYKAAGILDKMYEIVYKNHKQLREIESYHRNLAIEEELANRKKMEENAIIGWYNNLMNYNEILGVKMKQSLADEMFRYRFEQDANGYTQFQYDSNNEHIVNYFTLLGVLKWDLNKVLSHTKKQGEVEANRKVFEKLNNVKNYKKGSQFNVNETDMESFLGDFKGKTYTTVSK